MNIYTAYHPSPLGTLQLRCSDEHVMSVLFVDEEIVAVNDEHMLATPLC